MAENYHAILIALFESRFNPQKIKSAMQTAGEAGVSYGKSICKVRTGALRDGIGYAIKDDTTLEVYSQAGHSVFVNNGTFKMAGDQFFDKTIEVTNKTLRENLSKL